LRWSKTPTNETIQRLSSEFGGTLNNGGLVVFFTGKGVIINGFLENACVVIQKKF